VSVTRGALLFNIFSEGASPDGISIDYCCKTIGRFTLAF
jgi:hypothetical protein